MLSDIGHLARKSCIALARLALFYSIIQYVLVHSSLVGVRSDTCLLSSGPRAGWLSNRVSECASLRQPNLGTGGSAGLLARFAFELHEGRPLPGKAGKCDYNISIGLHQAMAVMPFV